jgi:hypothetical protein
VRAILGAISVLVSAVPTSAANDATSTGPSATQLEQFGSVEKVQCSMVNAVMAKILRKAGDKAHADSYALRALQFMNPDAQPSDSLASEVDNAANEAVNIVEKEAESKVELRSIIAQCDKGASIASIMINEKE